MSGYVVSEQVMLARCVAVCVAVFSNIVTSKEIVAIAGDPTENNQWNLPEFTT